MGLRSKHRDLVATLIKNELAYMLKFSTLKRYLAQSLEIVKTQGPGMLLERFRMKLVSMKRHYRTQPPRFTVDTRLQPLKFVRHPNPLVSIIIPVHNGTVFTFTCLKSIHEHTGDVAYEIIVVDDASDTDTRQLLAQMVNIEVIRNETNIGFLRSCNLGATKAKGQYLVFLNNDTIVLDNWLSALLETWQIDENTGLVGSQLIYPDGRLQEAGAIVFKDGTACNYGRLDDPFRPEYNYLREVDYCSGACLMIEKAVFHQIGGFDPIYIPSYYEDTDLAFKVRAAGKSVWYQPASVVVHFEGMTMGTSLVRGVKQYQEINRAKFHDKWRHVLASHGINGVDLDRQKERTVFRRLLVINSTILTPDKDSGSYRTMHMLKVLRNLDIKTTFAAMNLYREEPYTGNLQKQGIEVLYGPYVNSLTDYLKDHGGQFDYIMLCRADVADRLIHVARQYAPTATLIFDTVDLHFLRETRMAQIQQSELLLKAAQTRKQQELAIARTADITLVVSHEEEQILNQLLPGSRVEVVSNIHEVYGSRTPFDQRHGILFVGNFHHPPNVDAVMYYVREILPHVRKKLHGVISYIVGSHMPTKIRSLACADIRTPGYVEDLSTYFDRCRISIAPLRYGAGVKGKVNMSMSYGVPVVATSIAAEGMFLTHGHNILIADDAEVFAQEMATLYNDRNKWEMLSRNGLDNIHHHFSISAAKKAIARIFSTDGNYD